ncbi:hypothetical protein [Phytohabitans kaempferiae]|uniref:Uncharacterized protein n=1 Tax=Phytohabitans kaempferiae TaxID=1620943 RepID=A0ABV6M0J2_9ACTN
MPAPLLQARIITTPDHAQALIAELTRHARQLLGDNTTYRTQTRHADRTGYVRVYLTATRKEAPTDDHHDG